MSILKIRNILKIVSTFMILLSALSLLTSGSFYLIQKVLLNNEAVQGYSLWEFSLYILGYGSSPNVDIGMQLILSVMGIIMISLLSAFLTVNLFRRAKDVLVSRNLAVWKNKNGEYFASILIGNMGRPICNVSVAAQLFDPMGETIDVEDNLHDKPIIIKNHIWRVDYSIKLGSFMYEYFLNKYRGDGILKFYVLISFVDTETGQESIICREYKFEDAVAVSREKGFIYPNYKVNEKDKTGLSRRNSTVWKQFKSIKEDKASREGFCSFMHENIFYIDMKNAVPIIENGDIGAANITQDIRAMAVNLNFNSQDENTAAPGFIMGLIQFLPHRNWGPYYDKNYRLEFEISSSKGVPSVQLEIKDRMKNKILDEKIISSEAKTHYSFELAKLGKIENWMEVQEICFTVFRGAVIESEGEFTVKNIRLAE